MKYQCPICLTTELEEPYVPSNYDICPVCGIEYGYEDTGLTHEELRKLWIEAGSPDWREEQKQPDFTFGVGWITKYVKDNKELWNRVDFALGEKLKNAKRVR